MKKAIFALVLAICVSSAAYAAEMTNNAAVVNPVDQFTGEYWVQSSPDNKAAYLFGLESALAVEAMVAKLQAERAQKDHMPVPPGSPFVRNWQDAFKTTTRDEIVVLLDDWYASHPNQMDRPVMDVIWYDLITPRIKAMQR